MTAKERAAVLGLMCEAFTAYPQHVATFRPEEFADRVRDDLDVTLRYYARYGRIDRTPCGDAVAGWMPPGVQRKTRWGIFRSGGLWPHRRVLRAMVDLPGVAEGWRKAWAAVTPPPHWYLGLVATRPAARRRGLARMAMAPILKLADAQKVPCLLDTCDPDNLPAYEAMEFRVLHAEPLPGGVTVRVMGRGLG